MHSSVLLYVFPMAVLWERTSCVQWNQTKTDWAFFNVHDWAPFINNTSGFCPLACVDTSSVDTSSVSAGSRVDLAAGSIWYPHRQVRATHAVCWLVDRIVTSRRHGDNNKHITQYAQVISGQRWKLCSLKKMSRKGLTSNLDVLHCCSLFNVSLSYFSLEYYGVTETYRWTLAGFRPTWDRFFFWFYHGDRN